VKSDDDQKWIDQLRHEHKLYQKHLSALKAENERLESENANLKEQDQIISQEIKTYILIADKLQAENTELKQKLSSVWKEAERFYLED
jgi:FtsZ-binding cell division protein ZapB